MTHVMRIFVAMMFALFISACDRQGPAEEAGENIDDAVEDARDAMEDAYDATRDRVEDAGDRMRDTYEDLTDD